MAPVAVPTMDDLKLDDPKVEKKPDVVNDEEGDDDDDDEVEAEGGDSAAAGGESCHVIAVDISRGCTSSDMNHRCKEEEKEEEA